MRKIPGLKFIVFAVLCVGFSSTAFSSRVITSKDSATLTHPPTVSIDNAMKDFNSLSRHDKRIKLKEIKKAVKQFKAQKKEGSDVSTNTLLLIIIAILIPPLAVYIHEGDINNRFWLCVLLTILGYLLFGFAGIFFLGSLPGILYALYVILSGT